MSFTCMIVQSATITRLTKSFVIRSLFSHEKIEIEVMDKVKTTVYLEDVEKEKVWQAVAILESENLQTVYHVAQTKKAAFAGAQKLLDVEVMKTIKI